MTYLTRIAILSLGLSVIGAGHMPGAQAQVTADQMTCATAVATYERNGRIYVRSGSGVVLPIYVGVPLNQKTKIRCDSADQRIQRYNVKTKDARYCSVAYVCR